MDPEDSLEVPTEETTPEAPAPAEVPTEETTPAEEAAPVEPAPAEATPAAEPELFELPDGRKVDAATLSQLWKEDFYPEFTRRSQELARLAQGAQPQQTPAAAPDPLNDPNYIPPTYAELAAQIETRILTGMQERAEQEAAAKKAIEDNAIAQLTEVKASDPTVNEARLFQHAMKYQFTDLRLAHASMRDMDAAVKAAMTHTKESAAERVDPVSTRPGAATGARLDPDAFSSSVEYMRALKASGQV